VHDLRESVPFLYDNTVGDGPFNAWVALLKEPLSLRLLGDSFIDVPVWR
jgi:hypothetical protein